MKWLLFFTYCVFACFVNIQASDLTINLICSANGKGLQVDGDVLYDALTSLGCTVCRVQGKEEKKVNPADINIFCEKIRPKFFSQARENWFIPNPEYYSHDVALLESIDLILCRTKEVERIFNAIEKKTFYLGFTTPDVYLQAVKKEYYSYIHIAGSSPHKGTLSTAFAWQRNLDFPTLTLVCTMQPLTELSLNLKWITERLQRETLRQRQNECGVHICLSETEGFGHVLMEAMSSGAVVITTDAPPMNELIKDPRYLVPPSFTSQQFLATKYHVAPEAVEQKIKEILRITPEELQVSGARNREAYLERDRLFKANLKRLIENME